MSALAHDHPGEPQSIGPQGDALILELRRLQWALARSYEDRKAAARAKRPPEARNVDKPVSKKASPNARREEPTLQPPGAVHPREPWEVDERTVHEHTVHERTVHERTVHERHVDGRTVRERHVDERHVDERHVDERTVDERTVHERREPHLVPPPLPPHAAMAAATAVPEPEPPRVLPFDARAAATQAIERWQLPQRLDVARTAARGATDFILGKSAAAAEAPAADFVGRIQRTFEVELRAALRVLIISFGIGGGWATLVPLSGAVVLPGSLVVEGAVKKVQHPTGGLVAEIAVRDGMHVEPGALLLRLDETQVRAGGQVIANGLDQVRMRLARLLAERDGGEVRVPSTLSSRQADPALAQLIASEKALFAARATTRRGQKELLQSNIGQFTEQIGGLEAQAKSKTEQLSIIANELTGVQQLYAKGLVPLARLTTLQRETARLEGERGQLTSALAETRAKIGEAQLKIAQIEQDFRSDVMKELREQQDKEAEFTEKNIAAQDQLSHIDIRSPAAGVVHELAAHTVGGVIKPGDVIMEIVPDHDALEIEARLPPNEIDQVRRGQSASMRFTAFNQRTTPQVEGEVSYVSADLSRDEKNSSTYYTVRITLPDEERRRLHGLTLISGMPVEVFVRSGSRTMMSYLSKPITDQLHRMFNER
jgi:HlyD family secretion protein